MARFEPAVEATLEHEGGYVNHLSDPGGETNFGISKRSFPKEDIKNLTRERAIELYKKFFWIPNRYTILQSQAIANKVFDMAVNMGPRRAHFVTQDALRKRGHKIIKDGVMSDSCIEALNKESDEEILPLIREEAVRFYVSLNKPQFQDGWIRRAQT